MKICIVGAGAAGLAALRQSLAQGHECVAFEQSDRIGGTWNYTDRTHFDEFGLPIHSSMYQGLKTNLPKELMEYEDFPYEEKGRSFLDQPDVLDYMLKFATHFNLYPHIKFLRHILEIDPLPNKKWKVREKNLKTNEITEYTFDAVMVCVGNYSVPRLPNILGSEGLKENAVHSHHFRTASPYKGKKVLVIGAGPSGIDISRIVAEVAEKVYISYGTTYFGKKAESVVHKPLVTRFENNKAVFVDGSEELVDNVIYCTGYQYSYPFLTSACKITIENNWIKHLYKHIINVEHPSMAFIGVIFKVCPFPTFDIQIRFFLEFMKDPSKFTKEKMMDDVLKDVQARNEQAYPKHHVHKIGMALQRIYFEDLANTVKIKKVKPVVNNLYEFLQNGRNINKRYKIINDEEFIEVN